MAERSLCCPWCWADLPSFPCPFFPTSCISLSFLGTGGSRRLPGQISASHKGLCTSSPRLGFAVTSPDATISQFQSTRGWWDCTLFFACKLCTSNTRTEGKRRDDSGCCYRLSATETLPPTVAIRVLDGHMGDCRMGRIRESAKKEKGKVLETETVKADLVWQWSVCVCAYAPVHLHRIIQLSPK